MASKAFLDDLARGLWECLLGKPHPYDMRATIAYPWDTY